MNVLSWFERRAVVAAPLELTSGLVEPWQQADRVEAYCRSPRSIAPGPLTEPDRMALGMVGSGKGMLMKTLVCRMLGLGLVGTVRCSRGGR